MQNSKLANHFESSVGQKESSFRWAMLSVAFMVQMCCSFPLSGLAPIGPFIREGLGMTYAQFGLLFSAVNLGTVVMLALTGHIVDKIGVRLPMLIGQILMGLLMVCASFANAYWQILLFLFLAGICNSIAGPTTAKTIVTWFKTKTRATAMGIKQAGIPIAGVILGCAMPAACITFGWRGAFIIMGCCIAASGVISFLLYRDSEVMMEMKSKGTASPTWRESSKDVFTRSFIFLCISGFLMMGAQFAFRSYLVTYLGNLFTALAVAAPIVLAGTFYSVNSLGGGIGGFFMGMVSDRVFLGNRKNVLMFVNALGVLLLLLMAFVVPKMGLVGIACVVFAYGLFDVSWTGLYVSFATELTGFKTAGAASGISLAFGFAGMFALAPIFGAIVDITRGYMWGWIAMAVLTAIGVLLLIPCKESDRKA